MVRTRADGLIGSQSCTTFTVTSSASMPAALSIMTTTAAGATVEILELEKDLKKSGASASVQAPLVPHFRWVAVTRWCLSQGREYLVLW
jgi:hypothetical protein